MRLIIFSILEYNEKLIYYFVSRGARWADVIILEYNDIIGENRISEFQQPILSRANLVKTSWKKRGPEGPQYPCQLI